MAPFGPKWPILGPAILFQHLDHYQVVDIVILDSNKQNRQKLMHFEQENGLKPHFGLFLGQKLALNGPFKGQPNFFQHFDHHQILDIITLYHNMQNWQKLTHYEHEHGLKPHFGPLWPKLSPF